MTKPLLIVLAVSMALWGAIQYNKWLDDGCKPSGVMTWHGKVCFNDLTK